MKKPAMVTVYHRVAAGHSWEDALGCPADQPMWMYKLEQTEGRPLRELLEEAARLAPTTGYGLVDLSREWGVPRNRLSYWCAKWDIHFPRHGVGRHPETAANLANRVRRTVPLHVRQHRQALVRHLVTQCGSRNQLARLVGIGVNRVSDWHSGYRPVPDRWWAEIETLARRQGTLRPAPRRQKKPSADHPWRTP